MPSHFRWYTDTRRISRGCVLASLFLTGLAGCTEDPMQPSASRPESVSSAPFALVGTRAFLTVTSTQLTTNRAPQFDPSISGDIVVYTDRRDGNDDITFTNLATNDEIRASTGLFDERLHDVGGEHIVFSDFSTAISQVRIYDITTGGSALIAPSSHRQLEPTIDGDVVVFESYTTSGSADVAVVDLATGAYRLLTATPEHEGRPTVGGSLVVFERGPAPLSPSSEIVVYDLATDVETVLGPGLEPHTDGRYIAWRVGSSSDADIVIVDMLTGATETIAYSAAQSRPRLANGFMSFDDGSLGDPDVVLRHLPSGAEYRIVNLPGASEFLNDIDGTLLVYTSTETGNFDVFVAEIALHAGDIDPAPASVNFGDVSVGTSSTQIVTLENAGDADLSIQSIEFAGGTDAAYQVASVSAGIPVALGPGDVIDVQIRFTPSAVASFTGSLRVATDDYDEAIVLVPLAGSGVNDQSLDAEVAGLLAFFDDAVEGGSLVGDGPGKSAENRRDALRNMLVAAGGMIADGEHGEACKQFADAYDRTDGEAQPPDFVEGSAATELRTRIAVLLGSLGCPAA